MPIMVSKRKVSSSGKQSPSSPSPLTSLSSVLPLLDTPARFYQPDGENYEKCLAHTKKLYDLSKAVAPSFLNITTSLPTLLLSTAAPAPSSTSPSQATTLPFTIEQIYSQIQMHSHQLNSKLDKQIKVMKEYLDQQEAEAEHAAAADEEEGDEQIDDDDEEGEDEEQDEQEMDEDDEGQELDEDEDEEMGDEDEQEDDEDAELDGNDSAEEDTKSSKSKKSAAQPSAAELEERPGRGGVMEDAFFSLEDMERFADMYEEEQEGSGLEDDEEDDENAEEEEGEDDEKDVQNGEDDEDNEDLSFDEDNDDDGLTFDDLQRRGRVKKPSKEELLGADHEVDLDEETDEIDLQHGEQYRDFFDPPKRVVGGRAKKSMEDYYRDEDENEEYVDEEEEGEGDIFKQYNQSRGSKKKGDDNTEAEESKDQPQVDPSHLSSYEKQQLALSRQIGELEDQLVQPREWSLQGEVNAKQRPADGLLERNLEFEYRGKTPVVVTPAFTESLEDLIKKRIIDRSFDDVVRVREGSGEKAKKTREEVSDAKSEHGLAELYEREYLEEEASKSGAKTGDQLVVEKSHREISALVAQLFHKLDALSNFHFTPKPPTEVIIESNHTAALQMEEALPSFVSNAQLTTARQALDVTSKDMVNNAEMTQEERKARRRRGKEKKRKELHSKAAEEAERIRLSGVNKNVNLAEGITRKHISAAELRAATTARNVINAQGATGTKGKLSNSSNFFSQLQQSVKAVEADARKEQRQNNKKQRTH